VLVQAVLAVPVSVGTNVSSLLGQLDRYRDVIRNFADTDEAKQVYIYKIIYICVYVYVKGGRGGYTYVANAISMSLCVYVCGCVCMCVYVNEM